MLKIAYGAVIVGIVSLIGALISRFAMIPITVGTGGILEANAMLSFSGVCFLMAIALILLEKK